ncbi:hypothetical protein QUC26_17125 [Pseudomonas asiatica]|uniref:hypothetical protein n=1 Tax=Pseudomonas asiatica TaxID=2219225 RepID=UPI00259FEDC0|nr:hypothetical protein [Pseudomonas asiatica]MDM9588301.1 hypothetical protein [Pseudomonas asiatica]WJM51593.1 hypothetical protein QUC26_17125 [Pseudomonas asiatica]
MIKQRTQFDCGIATLANALSVGYDHALELYGHDKQRSGVTIQHTASILFNLSFAPVYTAFPGFTKASGIDMTTATPETLEHLGHPAILQVLTPSGVLHQVFFDGKNIHDPSPSIAGPRSISEYECVDAVILYRRLHMGGVIASHQVLMGDGL